MAGTRRHPLELIHPRSLRTLSGQLTAHVKGRLWLQVLIAMALGLAAGMAIGPATGWVPADIAIPLGNWLAFPGQLFLTMIQMIVVPLIFASIVRALIGTEDVNQLRRLGLSVVLYFVATTALAICVGLALAYSIKPGLVADVSAFQAAAATVPVSSVPQTPSIAELPQRLLGLLPVNPLNSMANADMLQIVIFAAVIGVSLAIMPPRQSKPLVDLMGSLQEVCMTVVRWAMWLAPYAVFGLLAQLTSKIGFAALLGMGAYVGTVLLGLLIMLAVYLVIVFAVAKIGPIGFLRSSRELLLLAFSTSSSAAVMPLSIQTAEEKFSVRPSISQFVIPLGATINMNGTALYQGVAAIFIAQVFGVDIGPGALALLILTAVGASIGAPGTPGVGIVIIAMLLTTIGVPPAGVALIMGVDRILDMSRTAINVGGDITAAIVMDRLIGGQQTAQARADLERRHDEARRATGEDVIVDEA